MYATPGSILLKNSNLVPNSERTAPEKEIARDERPNPSTMRYSWILHGPGTKFTSTKKRIEIARTMYCAVTAVPIIAAPTGLA